MSVDREEQEDELLALFSIFDSEEFVRNESKFSGEIRVCVELPSDFTVLLKEGKSQRQYDFSFLPPLCLTFELPEDYPSCSPPSFTLTCSWLTQTQLSALSAQLDDLYLANGGAVVLFTWIQFLKEDALKFLDIQSVLELPSDDPDPSAPEESHEDPQEAEALGQNNPTSPVSQTEMDSGLQEESLIQNTDSRGADQELKTSDFKAASEQDPPAQSDQSNKEETFSGDGSSASASPSSGSPHPLDPSGPRESAPPAAQSKPQTPCGLPLTPSQALLSQLLIFNAAQKQREFNSSVFDCDICLVGWLGSDCVQLLDCAHVFCRGCLGEFCRIQITEGNVRGVSCPNAECPAAPTPAQVRSLVGEELFSRYDRLLLQMSLDCMADVVYCPRSTCAAAVILENSSRAAMCSVCNFAFCVTCKKTYHGTEDCQDRMSIFKKIREDPEQSRIPLPQSKEGMMALWEDYTKGSKERKRLLESRYGRKILNNTMEECLSEDWIVVNSKNCPHCFCRIEKNGGCSAMMCTQCRRGFCWACVSGHFGGYPHANAYCALTPRRTS